MLLLLKSNRAVYDILVLLLSYPEKRGNLSSVRVNVDEDDEEQEKEKENAGGKGKENQMDSSDNHSQIDGDDCYNVLHFLFGKQ